VTPWIRPLFPFLVAAIGVTQQSPLNQADAISTVIVDRTGCDGSCPIYMFALQRQGVSTYAGTTGQWRGLYAARQGSVVDFDQLAEAISEIHFFDLPSLLGLAMEGGAQVIVTVRTARTSKTVTTYELERSPIAAVVKQADALADQLPWENLNEPRNGVTRPFPLRQVRPEYTEGAKGRIAGFCDRSVGSQT